VLFAPVGSQGSSIQGRMNKTKTSTGKRDFRTEDGPIWKEVWGAVSREVGPDRFGGMSES
jgi:hypothetical protein